MMGINKENINEALNIVNSETGGLKRRTLVDHLKSILMVFGVGTGILFAPESKPIYAIVFVMFFTGLYILMAYLDNKQFQKNRGVLEKDSLHDENLVKIKELFSLLETLIRESNKEEIQKVIDMYEVNLYLSLTYEDIAKETYTKRIITLKYGSYENKIAYTL